MKTAFCILIVSMFAFVGCKDKSKPCKCEDNIVAPVQPCPPCPPCPCPKCPDCPDKPKCPNCPKCENPNCPDGCCENCDCGCQANKAFGEARVVSGEVKEVREARSLDGGLWIFLKDEKIPYRVAANADVYIDGIQKHMKEVGNLVGPATVKVRMTFCKNSATCCKIEFFLSK